MADDSRWFSDADHVAKVTPPRRHIVLCGREIPFRHVTVGVGVVLGVGLLLAAFTSLSAQSSRYSELHTSTMSLNSTRRRGPRLVSPVYDDIQPLRDGVHNRQRRRGHNGDDDEGDDDDDAGARTAAAAGAAGGDGRQPPNMLAAMTTGAAAAAATTTTGKGTVPAPSFVSEGTLKFARHTDECELDVVPQASVSYHDFHANYVAMNRPVVIDGALSLWRAMKTWTMEYLHSGIDGLTVNVTDTRGQEMPITLKEFASRLAMSTPPDVPRLLLQHWPVFRHRPELRQDCFTPAYFADNWSMFLHDSTWRDAPRVSVLPETATTACKTEALGTAAWLAMVQGVRRVALVAPRSGRQVQQEQQKHQPPQQRQGSFSVFESKSVRSWKCTLKRGQLLYVPSGWWWQQQQRKGVSIAVGGNIINGYNLVHALTAVVHRSQTGVLHDVLTAQYIARVLLGRAALQATESYGYVRQYGVPRPLSTMLEKLAAKSVAAVHSVSSRTVIVGGSGGGGGGGGGGNKTAKTTPFNKPELIDPPKKGKGNRRSAVAAAASSNGNDARRRMRRRQRRRRRRKRESKRKVAATTSVKPQASKVAAAAAAPTGGSGGTTTTTAAAAAAAANASSAGV